MKSKEIGKDVASMNRVEDIIAASKLNDILKKKDDKTKNTVLWVLAIVGAVAAIAGIAYAVYSSHQIIWKILKKISMMNLMTISLVKKTRFRKCNKAGQKVPPFSCRGSF